jgi:hypothetical protein
MWIRQAYKVRRFCLMLAQGNWHYVLRGMYLRSLGKDGLAS